MYCILKNLGTIYNIYCNRTNIKSSYSIFVFKVLIFDLKVRSLGSMAHLCACSLLPGSSNVSFSLQEDVLIWNVDLQGQWHVLCACYLLLWSSNVSFSLKKKVFAWKFDLLRSMAHFCACSLYLRSSSLSSLWE